MVSVIIPVYNGEKYIKNTIDAILKSNYRDLEIIVVNDGSTDQSGQILSRLKKKDKRIKVYSKKNEGVVAARNYGISVAQGDFFCFCDQDDLIEPDMYQRLYDKIEADGSDIAMCSSGRILKGAKSDYDTMRDGVYEGKAILTELLYPILMNGFRVPIKIRRGNHYPHIWVCMFRRTFWQEHQIQFRAYVNFEDDLLVKTEALSKASKVSTIAYVGYYWRVNLVSETYALHYVEDIGAKQDACLADLRTSLVVAGASAKELDLFGQVTRCKQYLDAIHYLTSPEKKKTLMFIRDYCGENIFCRDFEHSIDAVKYLGKGRVKPKLILPLLKWKLPVAAYGMEKALDLVLYLSLHSKVLTRVERRMKG